MNQEFKLSREKLAALNRLVAAIRVSQNASEMMDDAFAALLGVNRTDQRCLDIVQRLGQITAGELAQYSGLTTGAVTNVIDRLEQAGYLRRVRDPSDRRKVLVELTELAHTLTEIVYSQIGEVVGESMIHMEIGDMELVSRFLQSGAGMNTVLAELLRDVADDKIRGPAERLHAAKDYAARVAREHQAIVAKMKAAWNDPAPGISSGKFPMPGSTDKKHGA
jgi:DNA-binding MarR family transcriptional regulator